MVWYKIKARIIDWIVRKYTDYYDLKSKHDQLSKEVHTLIFRPDSIEAAAITYRYQVDNEVNKLIWTDSVGTSDPFSIWEEAIKNAKIENNSKEK